MIHGKVVNLCLRYIHIKNVFTMLNQKIQDAINEQINA